MPAPTGDKHSHRLIGVAAAAMKAFLEPNYYVDADHPLVREFARAHSGPEDRPINNAVRLYYAVRDGVRYNPWGLWSTPEAFKASAVLARYRSVGGHCIDKANLLAASARVVSIPSRLHFANVRNHIGTEKLEKQLGTDLMVFHGYVELYLDGNWVAATPAFNVELCDHLGVAPLEFNGREDSIFQEYDRAGGRFMQYVHDYGSYADIPFDLMIAEWKKHYAAFNLRSWPGG